MDAVALWRDGRTEHVGHRLDARLDLPFSWRIRVAGISSYSIQLASGSHGRLLHRPLRPR